MPRGYKALSSSQIHNDWNDGGLPVGATSAGTPLPLYVSATGVLGVDLLSEAISVAIENVHVRTIAGATPQMDNVDKLAVSAYGALAGSAAGRVPALVNASGAAYVWLASALDAETDDIAVVTLGGATPTFTGGAQHFILAGASSAIEVAGASQITTIAGATPQMDDTDKLAVSVYGLAEGGAAGDTPLLTTATGHLYVWLGHKLDSANDKIGVQLIGGATPTVNTGALLVGRSSAVVTATVTLAAASPYVAGYLAGTGGVLTWVGAGREAGGAGEIRSLTLVDKGQKDIDFDVVFFNSVPVSTTFADCTPFVVGAGDLAKIAGVFTVATTAYVDFSAHSVAVADDIGIVFDLPSATTTLFGALIPRTAATFAADDVSIHLGLTRD